MTLNSEDNMEVIKPLHCDKKKDKTLMVGQYDWNTD